MTQALSTIAGAAPAIAMLGVFACAIGGGWLVVNGRDRKRGVLLLVMAGVLLANVLIWTV